MSEESKLIITIDGSRAERESRNLNRSLGRLEKSGDKAARSTKRLGREAKKTSGAFRSLNAAAILFSSGAAGLGIIRTTKGFSTAISELSAITGATGDDLEYLRVKAKEFGETTTRSASEAAIAMKLVASAKPDLLESGEALAQVTKEALTLAEAAGSTLPEAADTLGASLNMFSADADEASRFINVLAAGSKYGASEIANTAQALEYSGTVAADAGISFEELNASIQVLSTVAIKGSKAGSNLRNIFLKLQTAGDDDLNPSIVGLQQALVNLESKQLSVTETTKLFGIENVTAAKTLLNNIDNLGELTKKLTGTNTATEQATIRFNNLDGDLLQLSSAFEALQISLGEDAEGGVLREVVQGITEAIRELNGEIPSLSIEFRLFRQTVFSEFSMVDSFLLMKYNHIESNWIDMVAGMKAGWADFATYIPRKMTDGIMKIVPALKMFNDDLATSAERWAMSTRGEIAWGKIVRDTADLKMKALQDESDEIIRQNNLMQQTSTTILSELAAQKELLNIKTEINNIDEMDKPAKSKKTITRREDVVSETVIRQFKGLEEFIELQKEEAKVVGKSSKQMDIYNLSLITNEALLSARTDGERELISVIVKRAEAELNAKHNLEAENILRIRANELIADSRTELQEYNDSLAEYNMLREKGYLTDAQYNQLQSDLNEKNNMSVEGLNNKAAAAGILGMKLVELKKSELALLEAISDTRSSTGALTDMEAMREREGFARARIRLLQEEIKLVDAMGGGSIEAATKVNRLKAEIANVSKELELVADKFRESFEDAFADGFEDIMNGTKTFGEALKDIFGNIVNDINKMVARDLSQELMKLLGGGLEPGTGAGLFGFLGDTIFPGGGTGANPGGFFSSLFGGEGMQVNPDSLFGFANGGSFVVGGAGGVDSQLVAFKASPDERVTITKPGQESGKANNIINMVINVAAPNGRITNESMSQLQARVGSGISRATRRNT